MPKEYNHQKHGKKLQPLEHGGDNPGPALTLEQAARHQQLEYAVDDSAEQPAI